VFMICKLDSGRQFMFRSEPLRRILTDRFVEVSVCAAFQVRCDSNK
jgi:hypothetical protein